MAAPAAQGCGHCIEDRVAAVYDHAVIGKARERRHQLAFFALEGPLPVGDESRRLIARALSSETGVDLTSLRVSVDAASLSLAYDAERISVVRIGSTLSRKLAARGLRVSPLEPRAGRAANAGS